MALENTGEKPGTDFEVFLDKAQDFFNRIDTKKALRAARIFLKIVIMLFPRIVPMKSDERELFNDITRGAGDVIKEFDNP